MKKKNTSKLTKISPPILEMKGVSKHYKLGGETITALDNISLSISEGEFVSVIGPSGSGKSTFLQVASILGPCDEGVILIDDINVTQYDEIMRARLRNKKIGFIFQQFNLLPKTSAIDNVRLPLIYAQIPEKEQIKKSTQMLKLVGLGDRLNNSPAQLSGGQQQRVAIARALVNEPSLIFADEPTGNLDSKSGKEIIEVFNNLHSQGKTIILVTHDPNVAKIAQRCITFKDGKIISDKKN